MEGLADISHLFRFAEGVPLFCIFMLFVSTTGAHCEASLGVPLPCMRKGN
jgi:hypothetical protein